MWDPDVTEAGGPTKAELHLSRGGGVVLLPRQGRQRGQTGHGYAPGNWAIIVLSEY